MAPAGFGVSKIQRLLAERYSLNHDEAELQYYSCLKECQILQDEEDSNEAAARRNHLFQSTLNFGCQKFRIPSPAVGLAKFPAYHETTHYRPPSGL
jgi:hypothetical protein